MKLAIRNFGPITITHPPLVGQVKKCTVCGAQKPLVSGRFGLMGSEKKINFPSQILGVDLLGPFPRSSKEYTHAYPCCSRLVQQIYSSFLYGKPMLLM
jgi:hypothetical protein